MKGTEEVICHSNFLRNLGEHSISSALPPCTEVTSSSLIPDYRLYTSNPV